MNIFYLSIVTIVGFILFLYSLLSLYVWISWRRKYNADRKDESRLTIDTNIYKVYQQYEDPVNLRMSDALLPERVLQVAYGLMSLSFGIQAMHMIVAIFIKLFQVAQNMNARKKANAQAMSGGDGGAGVAVSAAIPIQSSAVVLGAYVLLVTVTTIEASMKRAVEKRMAIVYNKFQDIGLYLLESYQNSTSRELCETMLKNEVKATQFFRRRANDASYTSDEIADALFIASVIQNADYSLNNNAELKEALEAIVVSPGESPDQFSRVPSFRSYWNLGRPIGLNDTLSSLLSRENAPSSLQRADAISAATAKMRKYNEKLGDLRNRLHNLQGEVTNMYLSMGIIAVVVSSAWMYGGHRVFNFMERIKTRRVI